ncbi:sugar-transfer associated ATP-grasp domain-containing protein [uncultured Aquimarina sp.]|uniref:sugar-transfer associated ATP-grasp domain-containing protein n=1 Tax=uncultured Aquimarina sp. TaxID=575652 RepID=UPI00261A55D1|nr:sugar-transfer associated ATP-grasp domain-containing protein [uncultured Aquimarina sp.]
MKRKLVLLKKRVLVILNDNNRKGFFRIIKEAVSFWIEKKEFPYFYFGKFLYRKDVKNYKDYLSSKEVDKITLSKNLHHFQYASLLRNKLAFAFYMEKNNMPVPSLISYNLGNRFFNNSVFQMIDSKQNLIAYYHNLFDETGKTRIFVKAITEMGGTGTYLITKQNLEEEIGKYGTYILTNDCIHQEVIEQHDNINRIYEHSVNSIRFDTYIDKNNDIHILMAYMRFGSGGSVVDNTSFGGFYVGVDKKNGVLKSKSYQFMKYGGGQMEMHPDTGVVFKGYKIPYFQEACDLVEKCVTYIPDRIIGWDIAIAKNGPIIIEGNDNTSLLGPDVTYGGLLKHPLYKEILKEA